MKSFLIPIYDSRVTLVRTQGELERICTKLGVELPDKMADGVCLQSDYRDGTTKFVIGWMSRDVAVLAHEAVHLAQFILLRAGIDPKDSNGETMAYLVGYIVDKAMKVK